MAVGDIWRVSVMGRLHSQRIVNNWYYRQTAGGPDNIAAEGLALGNGWAATIQAAWLSVHSSEYTAESLLMRKIRVEPPPTAIEKVINVAGALGQESMPTSIAVVLRKRTAFAGPKYRGRIYLSGVSQLAEIDSVLKPTSIDDYNDLGAALRTVFTNGGYTFEPVHITGVTWFAIVSTSVDPVLRNQRRRQVGVGV